VTIFYCPILARRLLPLIATGIQLAAGANRRFLMSVRPPSVVALVIALSLSAAAQGQVFCGNVAPPTFVSASALPTLIAGPQQTVSTFIPRPTLDSLARQGYSQASPEPDSCQTHRQPNRLAQQRAQTRAGQPQPITSAEHLAAAKYQAAHLLWQAGKPAAAKRWLETILVSYPQTSVAARASATLAKL
jgi:hypothetical protein